MQQVMYRLESMAWRDSPISNYTRSSGVSLVIRRTFFGSLLLAGLAHHSLANLIVLLVLSTGILASGIFLGGALHSSIQ